MSTKSKDNVNLWDMAISDAEKKIQGAQIAIARLKQSIKSFKELRDSGEPFPGEKSDAAQK
jgi:hypothetical protein